jgi:hypothetical protein
MPQQLPLLSILSIMIEIYQQSNKLPVDTKVIRHQESCVTRDEFRVHGCKPFFSAEVLDRRVQADGRRNRD